jgi:prepilin-type N-terminal cleavage/methylation domain-containing protein
MNTGRAKMQKLTKRIMKVFRHGEKGFTLIELLVVIGILGVLGAVVALNVGSFIGSGHDEAACAELHNVQTAVLAYMAANSGGVPDSIDACAEYIVGTVAGTYAIGADGEVTQSAFDGGAAWPRQAAAPEVPEG